MNNVLLVLVCQSVRIVSILGACYLMFHGRDGWGWLIFIALFGGSSIKWKKENDKGVQI